MINARPPSITVIATITKHMLSRIVHKEEPLLQEEFRFGGSSSGSRIFAFHRRPAYNAHNQSMPLP